MWGTPLLRDLPRLSLVPGVTEQLQCLMTDRPLGWDGRAAFDMLPKLSCIAGDPKHLAFRVSECFGGSSSLPACAGNEKIDDQVGCQWRAASVEIQVSLANAQSERPIYYGREARVFGALVEKHGRERSYTAWIRLPHFSRALNSSSCWLQPSPLYGDELCNRDNLRKVV